MTASTNISRIERTVMTGNLMDGWVEYESYDEAASIDRYCEELDRRLAAAFPNATIVVHQWGASGYESPHLLRIEAVDFETEEAARAQVESIEGELYEESDAWAVEKEVSP